jgi:GNAT superfamily N-acetyltransferase
VEVSVERIPAAASYPLRHVVLRPHQSIEAVVWEGDDEPGTATFGAVERASGAIVGVATVFREPTPFDPAEVGIPPGASSEETTWRLRGMATREDLRGQGIGSRVLRAVLDHVAGEGGDLIWCNARVGAIAFYRQAGFEAWGDEWELPSIGPHVVMWRRVEAERAT